MCIDVDEKPFALELVEALKGEEAAQAVADQIVIR